MSLLSRYGDCIIGLQSLSSQINSRNARTASRVGVAMTTSLRQPRSSNVLKSMQCKQRVQELLLSVLRTDGMGGNVMGA